MIIHNWLDQKWKFKKKLIMKFSEITVYDIIMVFMMGLWHYHVIKRFITVYDMS